MEPENLECGRAQSLRHHSIAEDYMFVDMILPGLFFWMK